MAPPMAPLQVLFGEMWFMKRPRLWYLPAMYAPLSSVQTVSSRKRTSQPARVEAIAEDAAVVR